MPLNAKVLQGFSGATVLEIRANFMGDAFRAIYTVRFGEFVYVLHVFQKKSKKSSKLLPISWSSFAKGSRKTMRNGKQQKDVPIKIEISCGNVFADLGLENPEELLAKAKLIGKIRDAMEKYDLTETAAARQLGLSRSVLVRVLRGDLDRFDQAELKRFGRILRASSRGGPEETTPKGKRHELEKSRKIGA
jgi:predicted XRE-type DNA-binding protein